MRKRASTNCFRRSARTGRGGSARFPGRAGVTGRSLAASACLIAAAALPAGAAPLGREVLFDWTPDPLAIVAVIGLGWVYARGLMRAYGRSDPPSDGRVIAFYFGLLLVLAAMVSPLVAVARQSAFAHQVLDAALRVGAPLAIFAARPQRLIFAGLPKRVRRGAFAQLWRDPAANWLGEGLAAPLMAAAVNIAVFWFWLLPWTQDAAVTVPAVGWIARLSQLGAGCLFFGVLFDNRDPDLGGTAYGPRVLMLIASALVVLVTGVALTLKPFELYAAYPAGPRLLGFGAVDDEATAGFVNWAWVSLIYLTTIILVFFRWNAAEQRAYARAQAPNRSNSAALRLPETAEELWLLVTPKNRRVGLGLAIVPAVMMGLVIALVVTLRYGA